MTPNSMTPHPTPIESGSPSNAAEPSSCPRRVIINGDDFGFSTGVNRAIVEAHDRGVLTSTSLMVTGTAFAEAVELARSRPTLAVGLHLVLTCGQAVLPPSTIPHLVDDRGNFSENPTQAGLQYQFNSAARRELQLEIRAQLEKFRQTGLPLSHVDGHLHLHMHPVVLKCLVDLAKEFNIRSIRLPSEELWVTLKLDRSDWFNKLIWFLVFSSLRRYGERLLDRTQIQYADRVYGLLQSGRMTEAYLMQLIPQIQANWVEIYSHPAIALDGEPTNGPLGLGGEELKALLSDRVRQQLVAYGFTLAAYPGCQGENL